MSSPKLSKFLKDVIVPMTKNSASRAKGKEGTRFDVENYPGQIFRFDVDAHAKVLKGMHDRGEFANKEGEELDKNFFFDLLIKFCKEYEKFEESRVLGYKKTLKSGVSKGVTVKINDDDFRKLKKLKQQHSQGKYYAIIVRNYNKAKEFYTQSKADTGGGNNLHKKLTLWEETYLGKNETAAGEFKGGKIFRKGGKYENRFSAGFDQEIGHGYEDLGQQEGVASSGYTAMRAASNVVGSKEFQNAPNVVKESILKDLEDALMVYGVTLEQASKMSKRDFLKDFDLILTTQDKDDNRTQSVAEAAALEAVTKKMGQHAADLEGSLSLNEMINHFLMSSFQGNKYVKLNQKYKEKYSSNSRSKSVPLKLPYKRLTPIVNSGVQFSKKYIARRSLQKRGTRQKSSNRLNPLALINMINKKLPGEVEKNMGLPGLESRTGRFASSAKVVNFTEGKGVPTLDYTYQKNPYQVFEEGERGRNGWASTNRDPRRLIDRSIREVAKDLALARFNTRRI